MKLIMQWRSGVTSFFVYGSLRPDDDSGQTWTQEFVDSAASASPAVVTGAALFKDNYAAAVLHPASPGDKAAKAAGGGKGVVGYVMGFAEKAWPARLAWADNIEGFPSLYQRSVVCAQRLEPGAKPKAGGGGHSATGIGPANCWAWMYHRGRGELSAKAVCIPSGDWLQRDR